MRLVGTRYTGTYPNRPPLHDLPLAMQGLVSYRYKGRYGWIMIGARDDADALKQAERSLSDGSTATIENLQVWQGGEYRSLVTPN